MNGLILKAITLIHLLFILFVVLSPLSGSNYFMLLHGILIPFLIFHWVLNDNTCAITIVERYIRKKVYGYEYDDNDCITCRLIEPVYDFKNDYKSLAKFTYTITILLWTISISRLYCRYRSGEIKTWQQLFII